MGEFEPKKPEEPAEPINVEELIASMERETETGLKELEKQRLAADLQRRRDYLVDLERKEKESLEEIRNKGIEDSAQVQRLEDMSRDIYEPRIEETRQRIAKLEKELEEFGD